MARPLLLLMGWILLFSSNLFPQKSAKILLKNGAIEQGTQLSFEKNELAWENANSGQAMLLPYESIISVYEADANRTTWIIPDSLLGKKIYLDFPEWLALLKQNQLGLQMHYRIVLPGIQFAAGTSQLTPDARKKLLDFASHLSTPMETRWQVSGFSDNKGNPSSNQTLSQKRAQSVKDALVSQGIAEQSLFVIGRGIEDPIADNNTEKGRAQNRRVELTLSAIPNSVIRYYEPGITSSRPTPPPSPIASTPEEVNESENANQKAPKAMPSLDLQSLSVEFQIGAGSSFASGEFIQELKISALQAQEVLGDAYEFSIRRRPFISPMLGIQLGVSLTETLRASSGLRYQQIGYGVQSITRYQDPEFQYDEVDNNRQTIWTHQVEIPLGLIYEPNSDLRLSFGASLGLSSSNWAQYKAISKTDIILNGERDEEWSREREKEIGRARSVEKTSRIGLFASGHYYFKDQMALGMGLTYYPSAFRVDQARLSLLYPQIWLQFRLSAPDSSTSSSSTPSL